MIARKKSLIMLACALMIITSVAFGTIAYLTDRAGVTNRFTVGNVDIVVDENIVDENGKDDPDEDRTEEGNDYPLIPGGVYDKDPTMTVKAGSEEAYIRMIVTITRAKEIREIFEDLKAMYPEKYKDGFVPSEYVTGWNNNNWNFKSMKEDEASNTFTLEFRYPKAVGPTGADDLVLPALFKTIRIPNDLTNEHLAMLKPGNEEDKGFAIDVYGQAIQTAGFADAEAAWTAFDEQMTAVEKAESNKKDDDEADNGAAGDNTTGDNTADDNTAGDNAADDNAAGDDTTGGGAGDGTTQG